MLTILSDPYQWAAHFVVFKISVCRHPKILTATETVNMVNLEMGLYVDFLTIARVATIIIYNNPSARAGYDTRLIFKPSLTGLNSEFSFS